MICTDSSQGVSGWKKNKPGKRILERMMIVGGIRKLDEIPEHER
jgi:hypothetical protein